MFSGSALTEAAYEVQQARGPEARWYALPSPELHDCEKPPSLNGTSMARFRRILRGRPWQVVAQVRSPVKLPETRPGRPARNLLHHAFVAAARMPVLEELFLDRICFVPRKPDQAGTRSRT